MAEKPAAKKKATRSASARKRTRQTPKRTAVNRGRLGQVRTAARAVEDAIASGDKAKAQAALKAAEPRIARGGRQGTVHWRTAARKISRLAARVRKMA
ncbi:MAG: 30S ribosomal protein S20 [Pseudomonadota bacterium]